MDLSALAGPRTRHGSRPSWTCIFMKAYALVGAAHPPLRRSYLEFPWPRLYEHPWMNCALAIERTYRGEDGVFVGLFRAPSSRRWPSSRNRWSGTRTRRWRRSASTAWPCGSARRRRRSGGCYGGARSTSPGYKRCKRFGTFGLSSYGALGAEQVHPISPLTTTLTYGPIDPATQHVVVKLIYDHRVLDGAYVARRLRDIEDTLNGPILEELRGGGRRWPAARPRSSPRSSRC